VADNTERPSGVPYIFTKTNGGSTPLESISLTDRGDAAITEDWLQRHILAHPGLLPVAEIAPIFGPLMPLCRELSTPAGPVDNLYINELGLLTIAECKLWRNPQSRREVVEQILDYAAQISRWDYPRLEQAIGAARNEKAFSLYRFLREQQDAKIGQEATFIDNVTRNLRRGRFLLLIVGDGIREQVEAIGEFLQNQAHLNFSFALVETRLYRLPEAQGVLVVPRVLARTVEIERAVIRLEAGRLVAEAPSIQQTQAKTSGWRTTITKQYFYESLAKLDPMLPPQVQQFFDQVTALGLLVDATPAHLMIKSADRVFNFGGFTPDGFMRNYGIAAKTKELGLGNVGELYLEQLVTLFSDAEVNRSRNRFDWSVQKRDGSLVTIAECLDVQAAWMALIKGTLSKIEQIMEG